MTAVTGTTPESMLAMLLSWHARQRWQERGLPVTSAVSKWLAKIVEQFSDTPAKFTWQKGGKRITVVGAITDKGPLVLTVY